MFILDDSDQLDVSAFNYKTKSKPIETHPELGLKYHIITYRETFDGQMIEPDMFEAILGDPHHYGCVLLNSGHFGTICKKTSKSTKIVKEMYKDLVNFVKEQEIEYANKTPVDK